MRPNHKVESVGDFLTEVRRIAGEWDDLDEDEAADLWCRGAQKASWSLVPGLYRYLDKKIPVYEEEDEIREHFVTRAPSLTEYKPANEWEWYFLMQHYGAPTRLLDWTESCLFALYFATRDNEGLHDAAVWVLDPWWLNNRVLHKDEVLPPGSPGLSASDVRRYRPWLPYRFDIKQKRLKRKWPIAVYPNYFDHRIAAQRSCFTIHGLRREGLDVLFYDSKDHLAKITIPAFSVRKIRRELQDIGIDEVSIYPDLQGLGTNVNKNFSPKNENIPFPHAGLFTRLQPSPINGVGVFTIRKIKKGTRLFCEDLDEMMWVERDRLPKQKELRKFYDDFAVWKDGRYGCPKHFHRLTMSWYLNDPKTGEKPNVECDDNYEFKALRDIKPGEELTVNSHAYSEHPKTSPQTPDAPRAARKREF